MVTQSQLPMTPLERVNEPDMGTGVIDQTRYTSLEFAQLEWERMWTKVWNIRRAAVRHPRRVGDYFTHTLGRESFIFMRTGDDEFKGYYNVCPHRGSRIRPSVGVGHAEQLQCPFHLWTFNIEGELQNVPDRPALRERHSREQAAPLRGARRHVGRHGLLQHERGCGAAERVPRRDSRAPRTRTTSRSTTW